MEEKEIRWLDEAREDVNKRCHFQYLINESAADKLYYDLLSAVNILVKFPYIGPIEPLLSDQPICYRYLLVNRMFKIIYTVGDDLVEIHTVWDCRQDDNTLKLTIEK